MIDHNHLMTADEFSWKKYDLPEGGRWVELVEGKVVTLEPPNDEHGTAVLNLTKAMSAYVHQTDRGYACFELGLIVARDPDTVRCPAVSFFTDGDRFAEVDNAVTTHVPALVVEITSTPARRANINERIAAYLNWGVSLVWVIDPRHLHVTVHRAGQAPHTIDRAGTLLGDDVLPGFAITAHDIFVIPDWWWH